MRKRNKTTDQYLDKPRYIMGMFTCLHLISVLVLMTNIGKTSSAILSFNKVITSSSIHGSWVPARIIDGNTRRDADGCQCCGATKNEFNPWYQLDLGQEYTVDRVVIDGRQIHDYDQDFQNLQLFFKSIHSGFKNEELTETDRIYNIDFRPTVPKPTRYISIVLRNETRHLTICELTVYGVCVDGEYGHYCEKKCHCDGDPCNKTTGVCPSGKCLPGFKGQTCEQKCSAGKYGAGCTKMCGNCHGNDVCEPTKGKCPGKCSPGYTGDRCKTECVGGTFGDNCESTCGNCRDDQPCNIINGRCTNGCTDGYQTVYCDRECSRGTYGQNCENSCGNCKNDLNCHFMNGTCPAGCKAGFDGHICKTECKDGYFGADCRHQCGKCVAGKPCKRTTGYCEGGCLPGYIGDHCNKSCEAGFHGDGCLSGCGNCAPNTVCNHEDGKCTSGCDMGYKLPLCIEVCDDGTYGSNCETPCGQCVNNTACNKKNGTCIACEPGYSGHDCMIQLSKQRGDDDSSTAAIAGVLVVILVLAVVISGVVIYMKRRPSATSEDKFKESRIELNNVETTGVQKEAVNVAVVSENKPLPSKHVHKGHDENAYYGFITKKKELKICQLWDYIYQKKKDSCVMFFQEFNHLKQGLLHPHDVALMTENKPKNRYRGLCAYDNSRVPLDAEEDESEYINASYINGQDKEKKFIASQGPTKAMRDDFWRMIWQQKSQKIVMVTNLVEMGTEKCLIYWPEKEDVTYGNVTIKLVSETMDPDFVTRHLQIRNKNEEWRSVTQYHFRAWPDKDVPDSTWSLVKFWMTVMQDTSNNQGPIVVHCSAGIGRTGTFIALDNAYHMARSEGTLNMLDIVTALREQRVNMVQTKEQYVYLHEAVSDMLLFGTHYIWSSQFEDVYRYLTEDVDGTKLQRIRTQYDLITESVEDRKTVEQDSNDNDDAEYINVFIHQNKVSTSVTIDAYTPKSKNMAVIHELGAILLPNYEEKDVFIMCKSPTDSSLETFWSLITEQNVKTVLMLTESTSSNYTSCSDLGATKTSIQTNLKVSQIEERQTDYLRETHFAYDNAEGRREVHQFEYKGWPDKAVTPKDTQSMLSFLEVVLDWQQRLTNTEPVLVHCCNGFERSGLICILLNEFERMRRDEGHINIVQSVKFMKERNEHIIPNFDQYMYVYDLILSTFRKGDVYANC